MTAGEVFAIVGTTASIVTVLGMPVAFIRWIRRELRPLTAELRPNGGSSMKDAVSAIHDELLEHQEDTNRRFDQVDSHLGRQDQRIDSLFRVRQ
jgi:hypothetical protein